MALYTQYTGPIVGFAGEPERSTDMSFHDVQYVGGADLASTRYPAGTPAWNDALSLDLSQGLLTQGQYDWALQNPGMGIPMSAGSVTSGGGIGGFFTGLASTADVLLSSWFKAETMNYQRDLLQQDIERRRLQMETGLPQPLGYGGINTFTLIALAGVALMAMLLLKKP